MIAHLYNCIKRRESTMPPNGTTAFCTNWTTLNNVVLKKETSIVDPVFELRREFNAYEFNYIYVPALGRGYWIADYAYNTGVWIVSAHVDVLGSFKLPETAQYIARTSSNDYNVNIVDNMVRMTGRNRSGVITWGWPFAETITEGRFIVGIISKTGGQYGAVTYYSMTSTQLNNLMANLMGDVGYMNISASEISEGLQRGLINPIQYIASCMWVPWIPATSSTVTNIDCGWWTFPVGGGVISTPQKQIEIYRKTFGVHPQILTVGKWLMSEPYSDIKLFAPPWGIINIPLNKIDVNYISPDNPPAIGIECWGDAISGLGTLEVSLLVYHDGDWIGQGRVAFSTTQLGITIPLAQSSQNAYSAALSATSSASYAVKGTTLPYGKSPRSGGGGYTTGGGVGRNYVSSDERNSIGDIVGRGITTALNKWQGLKDTLKVGAMATVADAMGAQVDPLNVVGSAGSYLNLGRRWAIEATYNEVVPVDNANMGRPLCIHDFLSKYKNQFVQISTPHYVADNGNTPPSVIEMEEYESAMESGIFIEE